jgi:hypothetical protein
MKHKRTLCFTGLAMLVLVLPAPAHAYVDPGTGSVITTAILGLFAAVAYTFRKYMYRIKDFLSGRKGSSGVDRKKDDRP